MSNQLKHNIALQVGITGGIGSGKTTVCKIFEVLGIPVYYSDDRAKALMTTSPTLVEQIKQHFGEAAYLVDGSLNRKYIGQIVFKDAAKLRLLNGLVHPEVYKDATNWHHQQDSSYTLREAALLFEAGSFRQLDCMITVYAPKTVRLKRVLQRDQTTVEAILDRMNKQLADFDKILLSDFVITNNGKRPLIEQVLNIHQSVLQRAERNSIAVG